MSIENAMMGSVAPPLDDDQLRHICQALLQVQVYQIAKVWVCFTLLHVVASQVVQAGLQRRALRAAIQHADADEFDEVWQQTFSAASSVIILPTYRRRGKSIC
jgi:hypothetical protein